MFSRVMRVKMNANKVTKRKKGKNTALGQGM